MNTTDGTADHPPREDLLEPLLDVDDIQGNILAGFRKNHQVLLGVSIHDAHLARKWLQSFINEIATTREVWRFNQLFRGLRARRGGDPEGIIATWTNVAFSADGLRKLTSDAEVRALPDASFREGMLAQSRRLRDPSDPVHEGNPTNWKVGARGKVPDVLVIVASDDLDCLGKVVGRISDLGGAGQPIVIWQEQGDSRSDLPGHEHFGFRDGVSQPAVRGRVSAEPEEFLTERCIEASDPRAKDWAMPGQPLVPPGHFVLGYPRIDHESGELIGASPLEYRWFKNGSFLVFRRLRQDVRAFREFLASESTRLRAIPGFEQMTPEHLGGLLVGRWPHGAPVLRASFDDKALGDNTWANNNFLFDNSSAPASPRVGTCGGLDPFPPAPADQFGDICPHAAHIRKVNPRDENTDFGLDYSTLTRRILRRGIPFGAPLPSPTPPDDRGERGLHFLCYQASIERQFESLMIDWANETLAPKPGGHDLIIGQDAGRERKMLLRSRAGDYSEWAVARAEWVIPTGGGYFFSPSISAIRTRLCGPAE